MEKRGQVAEIFLGLILIVLLIMLVFLVLTISSETSSKKVTAKVEVQDSSNIIYSPQRICEAVRIPYQIENVYYDEDYREKKLSYKAWSDTETYEGIIQNDVDKYTVHVRNIDHDDGYFTVIFTFYDYYHNKNSIKITKRINPGETEEFVYRNIYKYKNSENWTYKVISETERPYNSDYHRTYTYYKTEYRCYWA